MEFANAQLAVFSDASVDVEALFLDLTGSAAESYSRSPLSQGGGALATGPYEVASLTVSAQIGRCDIFLAAAPDDGLSAFPPALGTFEQAEKLVRSLATRSGYFGRVSRLSVVLNFQEPCETSAEAFHVAALRAGVRMPFEDGSDLIIRANRRATIANIGLPINRVLTLSSVGRRLMTLSPTGTNYGEERHLALLQVDVNTLPEQEAPAGAIQNVWPLLYQEAVALSSVGSFEALVARN